MDITKWSAPKSDGLYSLQAKMEKLYTVSKIRPGADYGLDHELLIATFSPKLKKVGKTIRPFRYEGEVAQSCPTLSDPMVCSLPGSSIHGIFQARVLESDGGATAFSKESYNLC